MTPALDSIALVNGRIWTGNGFAKNLLIRGDRIAAVGDDVPSADRKIDIGRRLTVPGFIDNHVHFVLGGLQLSSVQLRAAESPEEFARRIGERAAMMGSGRWITGSGWDEQRWPGAELPTRALIDPVAARHPVFVTRNDLHMGVANSVALKLAGIDRHTEDPAGGTIVRDPAGEPTGLLKDAAMALVQKVIPEPTIDERVEAIRLGLREAARSGVTSFCNMAISDEAFDDFRAFQRLHRSGELSARVWMYLPIHASESVIAAAVEKNFGSDRLRIAGFKGFADGSLGSSTAAFCHPYEGEPRNRGLMMEAMENGVMAKWITEADARDLQLAIHAIGDRAIGELLSIFESLPRHRDRRLRIEHAQHLDEMLVRRIAEGRTIASMQPYHAVDDGRWAEKKIGAERARFAFAFRSLLDAGAIVTFGSDWPVAPLNPLTGIDAAVTRRTLDAAHPAGWVPEQRIPVAEAMRCYTANNAFAVHAENEIGAIAPGMRADLAVLSHDIFSMDPGEIANARAEMTIFDGNVIYEA